MAKAKSRAAGPKRRANGNGNGENAKRNGNGNNGGNQNMQVQRTMNPLAVQTQNVRQVRNKVFPLQGSDFIQEVTVIPQPTTAQRILAVMPISPSAFPGTRLTQQAATYQFFRFVSLRLRWVPSVPVTLACQFVLFVDLDPNDDPADITDSDQLVRKATAQTGSQQWNFINPKAIPMALRTDQQFYFTGEPKQNLRFNTQAIAYLVQITDALDFNGSPIAAPISAGSIFFDWNIHFNIPFLDTTIVAPPLADVKLATLTANDGTTEVFAGEFLDGDLIGIEFNPSVVTATGTVAIQVGSDNVPPVKYGGTATFEHDAATNFFAVVYSNGNMLYAIANSSGSIRLTRTNSSLPASTVLQVRAQKVQGNLQKRWRPKP